MAVKLQTVRGLDEAAWNKCCVTASGVQTAHIYFWQPG